jgi:hypothetical protein
VVEACPVVGAVFAVGRGSVDVPTGLVRPGHALNPQPSAGVSGGLSGER